MTANERYFFETLYQVLVELRDIAQHLNLKSSVEACNELLQELEQRADVHAAAESSE